jgi:cytochrome c553
MSKPRVLAIAVAIAALCAACASPERSRSLNDPTIPAMATAQQVCSNCHGIDGNAVSPNFPRLAGQPEPYLVSQLKAFRGHDRSDPQGFEYMWGLSRSLSDTQIEHLAAYFAAQKPLANPAHSDPALAARGRVLFENGKTDKNLPPCMACHGDHAQGNQGFPRLAGQHADYVVKQLDVFQRTDERPEGAVMKTIAHLLDHDDIEAVAAYVQSVN